MTETSSRGVAATRFVRYIDRSREFYAAQGFERPYRWASFEDVPFVPLADTAAGDLGSATVALLTTANDPAPPGWRPGERRPPRAVYSVPSSAIPERFFTDDLSWDKKATHTDDLGSYFPIDALRELAAEGRIGGLAEHCHGVPTEYSQRRTLGVDAPELLRRCREDGADVALLVPL